MELIIGLLIVAVSAYIFVRHYKRSDKSDVGSAEYRVESTAPTTNPPQPGTPTLELPSQTPAPEVVTPSQTTWTEFPRSETKCGCGRSPTGNCVGLHKLTVEEWAVHADNPHKLTPKTKAVKRPRGGKMAEGSKDSKGDKPKKSTPKKKPNLTVVDVEKPKRSRASKK